MGLVYKKDTFLMVMCPYYKRNVSGVLLFTGIQARLPVQWPAEIQR